MSLGEDIQQYLRAGFTGLWVETFEFADALREITPVCVKEGWPVVVWDFAAGIQSDSITVNKIATYLSKNSNYQMKPLPLAQDIPLLTQEIGSPRVVWVLKNFHHQQLIFNLPIMQAIQNATQNFKGNATSPCVVIMSPIIDIPREVEKDFTIIEHELPTKDQLWAIAENICETTELPQDEEAKRVALDAAAGMSRRAFEDALGLSLAKHGRMSPEVIWDLKAQDLKKRGILEIYSGTDTFDSLGGLSQFKAFSKQLLKRRDNPLLRPHGLLLLGVPGAGKSALAKALGNETQRKVLMLDMGAMRSKFQGETDANVRAALKMADAMQPCVLFLDELEKALSGAGQSSAMTDGGSGDRIFGKLLCWLNDHTSDVFFIGTCNNIHMLPPEFSRAERFDAIFFVDVPTEEERMTIWQIYLHMYGHAPSREAKVKHSLLTMSNGWTGAEIKACCRLAAIREVPLEEAASQIVPVTRTADSKLKELREWASGRCLNASAPGLYDPGASTVVDLATSLNAGGKRRTVTRPTMN